MRIKYLTVILVCLSIILACDSSKSPTAPTTTSIPTYSTRISGLTYIKVSTFIWENWDEDIEKDGFRVYIRFLDNNDNEIEFSNVKCRVRIKLFAYKKDRWGIYRTDERRQVYSKNHYFTSSNVSSILESPLKIWDYEIKVNKETDYWCGDCEVTVHTPEQGDFSDVDEFCRLYPD